MKLKLLSLLLAASTLLTLTACDEKAKNDENKDEESEKSAIVESSTPETSKNGSLADTSEGSDKSDLTEESEATSETLPEEKAFPFAGTWRAIQRNAIQNNDYIVVDNLGNLTEYRVGDDGKVEYTFEYVLDEDNEEIVLGEDVSLKYDYKSSGNYYGRIDFISVGESYSIRIRSYSGTYTYYYCEDDFNTEDYDVVELTSENVSEYVKEVFSGKTKTNEYGEVSIQVHSEYRFKEGLGIPSFILGELTCKNVSKSAIYDSKNNEIVLGEVVETKDNIFHTKLNFCAAGSDAESYTSPDFTDNGDGTYSIPQIWTDGIIGAEKIYGKVYVPKDWNK